MISVDAGIVFEGLSALAACGALAIGVYSIFNRRHSERNKRLDHIEKRQGHIEQFLQFKCSYNPLPERE